MLAVGPLGDDAEALRLEGMAGRGGGGNARSVHAVRCFNAQVKRSLSRRKIMEKDGRNRVKVILGVRKRE